MTRAALVPLVCTLLIATRVLAQIPESMTTLELGAPGPHWVWVDDDAFYTETDGRSYLVDADTGEMLGMLSTGLQSQNLQFPRAYDHIYSAETYYSRGTRGERTDLISIYDPRTLAAEGEIVIPAKRQNGIVLPSYTGMTDDDHFMMVYNFTPAQSVTVADLVARKVAAEIPTPGCALIYPGGARRFAMICGDGALLTIDLADDGSELGRSRSAPFFDLKADPVTEQGVRLGNRWLFVSFAGMIHGVDLDGAQPGFATPWSVVTDSERRANWRISGAAHLAIHEASRRLYVLMHRGGPETRKAYGTEVWVFDTQSERRLRRIRLTEPANALEVTPDDAPLLVTTNGESTLQIYDAVSGRHLRSIRSLGFTQSLIQALPHRSP